MTPSDETCISGSSASSNGASGGCCAWHACSRPHSASMYGVQGGEFLPVPAAPAHAPMEVLALPWKSKSSLEFDATGTGGRRTGADRPARSSEALSPAFEAAAPKCGGHIAWAQASFMAALETMAIVRAGTQILLTT
eukprot:CAMPEP_0179263600 /NCGR_PEP_ID=MMETSP0797-20121207/27962_1 /TAXON_ID=47934 /ORGANISM="Dinophysis acuminata, Strain DAEP01" /LENGTH=136 /DNA_ID=CAMNT_0020971763 /DNA_START=96 /DNA_END=503 /DNA_ORIENTATION=+